MPYRKKSVKQKKRGRKSRRRQRGGSQENNNVAEAIRLSLLNQEKSTSSSANNTAPAPVKTEPLATMPQICFGTAQGVEITALIKKALSLGYRHFDGADSYGGKAFRKNFRDGIAGVDRHSIWITWKSNDISLDRIQQVVTDLNCEYIDLFLRHHSCLTPRDYAELQKAKNEGLVRFIGVSNCENIKAIEMNKNKYDIYANQIQARPPGGDIQKKPRLDPDFIKQCNALGVSVMMFGTISGLINAGVYLSYNEKKGPNINKYYIQKYLKPSNVLMVSSMRTQSQTLQENINYVNTYLSGNELLKEDEMSEMEELLKAQPLADMSK